MRYRGHKSVIRFIRGMRMTYTQRAPNRIRSGWTMLKKFDTPTAKQRNIHTTPVLQFKSQQLFLVLPPTYLPVYLPFPRFHHLLCSHAQSRVVHNTSFSVGLLRHGDHPLPECRKLCLPLSIDTYQTALI